MDLVFDMLSFQFYMDFCQNVLMNIQKLQISGFAYLKSKLKDYECHIFHLIPTVAVCVEHRLQYI